MENLWLLAQMRQPRRSIYSDLTPSTFSDFLKILLNKRNFNFKKEVDGQLLSQLCWAHCLSYEYELRKEAYKKCRTTTTGITAALHSTYEDIEHRTQHGVQLVAMANSTKENEAKMAKLEREVQELRNMVGRSRSPRMQPRQKALPAPPQQLALPSPQSGKKQKTSAQRPKKGKGKGGKGKTGSTQFGGSSGSGSGGADFDQLMLMGRGATSLFYLSNKDKPICFNFHKRQRADPKDLQQEARMHRLWKNPNNECFCLQSRPN